MLHVALQLDEGSEVMKTVGKKYFCLLVVSLCHHN